LGGQEGPFPADGGKGGVQGRNRGGGSWKKNGLNDTIRRQTVGKGALVIWVEEEQGKETKSQRGVNKKKSRGHVGEEKKKRREAPPWGNPGERMKMSRCGGTDQPILKRTEREGIWWGKTVSRVSSRPIFLRQCSRRGLTGKKGGFRGRDVVRRT